MSGSQKFEAVFNECHEAYTRERLLRGGSAVGFDPSGKGEGFWTKRRRPSGADYRADFAMVGYYALHYERADARECDKLAWRKRLKVFRWFYVYGYPAGAVYKYLVRVPRGTFDDYCSTVKRVVGKELARAGLKPGRYFGKGGEQSKS